MEMFDSRSVEHPAFGTEIVLHIHYDNRGLRCIESEGRRSCIECQPAPPTRAAFRRRTMRETQRNYA